MNSIKGDDKVKEVINTVKTLDAKLSFIDHQIECGNYNLYGANVLLSIAICYSVLSQALRENQAAKCCNGTWYSAQAHVCQVNKEIKAPKYNCYCNGLDSLAPVIGRAFSRVLLYEKLKTIN